MQAKQLIIPQQINPFGAILKGMSIEKSILFQISMTLQQVPSILCPVDTSDFFFLDVHLTAWEMDYIPSVQCCW